MRPPYPPEVSHLYSFASQWLYSSLTIGSNTAAGAARGQGGFRASLEFASFVGTFGRHISGRSGFSIAAFQKTHRECSTRGYVPVHKLVEARDAGKLRTQMRAGRRPA